jgi:ribosome-binding factor A
VAKRRNRRVDVSVRQALAELLEEEIADPRTAFVTLTDVEVSEDHKHATVYYTVLDQDLVSEPGASGLPREDEVAAGLASAAPRLQGLLARRVRLKNTPGLQFEPDEVAAEGRRIEELLRRVRSEDSDGDGARATGEAGPA